MRSAAKDTSGGYMMKGVAREDWHSFGDVTINMDGRTASFK